MRLLLLDRIVTLEPGARITGRTAFSLSGEHLRGHFPRSARVPASVLLESMAQLVAWAVVHTHDFQLVPLLCLAEGLRIEPAPPAPGFAAELGGEILSTRASDSLGRAWIEVGGRRVASVDRLIYRHFPATDAAWLRRLFAQLRDGGPTGAAP